MRYVRSGVCALCAAFILGLAALSALSLTVITSDVELQSALAAVFSEPTATAQAERFYEAVLPKLRFATARSLCGRDGKWMAFVDIYQYYEDGQPSGCSLQQATVQYGILQLPSSAQQCTLKVGASEQQLEYQPGQSIFTFDRSELPVSALTDEVSVSVKLKSDDFDVSLREEYPSGGIPGVEDAIKLMTPAYIAFADGETDDFQSACLKLRSYLKNTNSMQRSFTWELYLLQKADLPSKATIVRYDLDTRKVSVTQRMVKEI